jgi:hypothetical protein
MPPFRLVLAACTAALMSLVLLAPAANAQDGLRSGALYYAGPDGR